MVSTSILAVCKQIHSEAAHILYTQNTFEVSDDRSRPSAPSYSTLIRRAHLLKGHMGWEWMLAPTFYTSLLGIENTWPNLESVVVELSPDATLDLFVMLHSEVRLGGGDAKSARQGEIVGEYLLALWKACDNSVPQSVKSNLLFNHGKWFKRVANLEKDVIETFEKSGIQVCCITESVEAFTISLVA